jgi:DNA-directed RNA polymerase specialized sigma24 family protein
MSEQELEAFYRDTFLPLVRRATWKHRLAKEDAADIVQDAFLLALGKLDAGGNPKAWLIQVVDHLSVNLQRKASRRTKLSLRWGFSNSHDFSEELEELSGMEEGVRH